MKILIYGGNGWIGTQFQKILQKKSINYIIGKERCDDNNKIYREIKGCNPTHVVSFIGRTHDNKDYTTIDYLSENIRDNLYAPLTLAHICKKEYIHYTYLGTGCIFQFDENHPYGKEINGFKEGDTPNFFGSQYSIVKGYTDRLMYQYDGSALNLRMRMPISDTKNVRNYITKITNYEYICSQPNSMTVLSELLPIALNMMEQNITGTYNFTNPGLITHDEILEMYKHKVDPNFTWKKISPEQQENVVAPSRPNNYLDTNKLERLYPNVSNIKISIGKLFDSPENFK